MKTQLKSLRHSRKKGFSKVTGCWLGNTACGSLKMTVKKVPGILRSGHQPVILALIQITAWALPMVFATAAALPAQALNDAGAILPMRLRCDYVDNPMSIDSPQPRLSWELKSREACARGLHQTAYRILVASSAERLAQNEGDLWDSGKITSDETLGVAYAGRALTSRERCWWKVKVWDQAGRETVWSDAATWSMGLLRLEDWSASWISEPPLEPATTTHWGYRSAEGKSRDDAKWVAIDLGTSQTIDAVRLWPSVFGLNGDVTAGDGFPRRMKIEVAAAADFSDARLVADYTQADLPRPEPGKPLRLDFAPGEARYVRLTATDLTGRVWPGWDPVTSTFKLGEIGSGFNLILADMEVLSAERNVALNAAITALDSFVDPNPVVPESMRQGWSPARLTDGRTAHDPGSEYHQRPPTLFRKEFTAPRKLLRATLYATALGCYELWINGKTVGDQRLAPGWVPTYHQRALYQTYDVTGMIREGANAIGAQLGDGWHRMRSRMDLANTSKSFNRFPGPDGVSAPDSRWFLSQLELEYTDGTKEAIGTDQTWLCSTDGPVRNTSMFDGSTIDARKSIIGWDLPGLTDTAAWQAPRIRPLAPLPVLSSQIQPPIRVIQTFPSVGRTETSPGVYVYDFGQCGAGVCRVTLDGPAGTEVRLRYAQELNPDGTIHLGNLMGVYNNNDVFILDGKGPRTFEAPFTYHGFRYVQVTGGGADAVKQIEALAFCSDVARATQFSSSDPRLNRLVDIIDWGYRSNMVGLITDASARDERMPWLGDCLTDEMQSLCTLYDFAAFGANENRTIVDSTDETGIPPVMLLDPKILKNAGWSDGGIQIPHDLWLHYADRSSLERSYPKNKQFMDTLDKVNPEGLPTDPIYVSQFAGHLGANMTIPPGATAWQPRGTQRIPPELFATATWAHSAELVSQMAEALAQSGEAAHYAALTAKVRAALVKKFVTEDGKVAGEEQGSYAMTLGMDHLPIKLRVKAMARLLQAVENHQNHLATGSFDTIFLLKTLSDEGLHDMAWQLVMQPSCPSYGFMVDQGATAMWERFDSRHPVLGINPDFMNDFSHVGLNSVFEWIFRYVIGIRPDLSQPGYKHFTVGPKPGGGLTEMKAEYASVRGPIKVAYAAADGTLTLDVAVPPNTTASVCVPVTNIASIMESGKPATAATGVRLVGKDEQSVVFLVESGEYHFSAPFESPPEKENPNAPENLAAASRGHITATSIIAGYEPVVPAGGVGEGRPVKLHHGPTNLVDGVYGNDSAWIPNENKASFTLDLGTDQAFGRFRLGRDRLGSFADRTLGALTIEVSPDATTWRKVHDTPSAADMPGYRPTATMEVQIEPVKARYVRATVNSAVPDFFPAIDEFEVLPARVGKDAPKVLPATTFGPFANKPE